MNVLVFALLVAGASAQYWGTYPTYANYHHGVLPYTPYAASHVVTPYVHKVEVDDKFKVKSDEKAKFYVPAAYHPYAPYTYTTPFYTPVKVEEKKFDETEEKSRPKRQIAVFPTQHSADLAWKSVDSDKDGQPDKAAFVPYYPYAYSGYPYHYNAYYTPKYFY